MGKKLSFGPKNVKKMAFLGFSHITPLIRFAFLLHCSDDAQTYRMAAHLAVKGVPIIKRATLVRKKLRFGRKNVEITGFLGFSDKTSEKRFAILL